MSALVLVTLLHIFSVHPEIIDCTGKDACSQSGSKACGSTDPCRIQCDGVQACKETTLIGDASSDFTVICVDDQACTVTTIECPVNGRCNIYCGVDDIGSSTGGQGHCKDSVIRCGSGDCLLTCDTQDSCESITVQGASNSKSFWCRGYCSFAPPNSSP
eukprot:323231_1